MAFPAIADYAVIGDCRTAALVSRAGEVAWLCLPHFSSASVFGSLLDPDGGTFAIAPIDPYESRRRYLPGTNVLETTFTTNGGQVRLTDAMVIPSKASDLHPMRELLRCVECIRGEVRLRVVFEPRPDFARAKVNEKPRSETLRAWQWKGDLLMLHADAPVGELVLRAGDRRWLSLTYAHREVGTIAALGGAARERLDATAKFWESWSSRAKYDGPHREAVIRSALVLKLLCCSLSGAVIAAPTTSLPEWIGADRNWDYRYCWLRDAALTMRAFTGLGYLDEARAFLGWLLHATRLTWPKLGVLYDIYGRNDAPERRLDRWSGFAGSKPVRIGNDAREQTQLDVYGAVCYAARNLVEETGELDRAEAKLLAGFGKEVARSWMEPDHGIWEIRDPRRAYTFSRIMAWLALDSVLGLERRGRLKLTCDAPNAAQAIRDCVESRGFNVDLNSYVGVLDGTEPDASLLLAGCLDYRDPRDERMRGTFDFVERRLGRKGLLYRYERGYDGIDAPEGAFGICSFLAVDHLAVRGETKRAHALFSSVMGHANDVGLLAEEIDPESGALLGNFPQAYTHVGVINAAFALHVMERAA